MNKITVIGNLTRDPETRTVNGRMGETTVCSFGIADNARRGGQNNGQQEEQTMFYNVSVWGNRGNVCQQYMKKGHRVCVIGTLSMRTYTGNDGQQHTSLEIRADDFEMLTSRNEAQNMSAGAGYSAPAAPAAPTAQNNGFATQVGEDELPF